MAHGRTYLFSGIARLLLGAAILTSFPVFAVETADIKMVVVFQKQVEKPAAEAFMQSLNVEYYIGGDGSRGKQYFYSHGPQFVATVPAQKMTDFSTIPQNNNNVFEVYRFNKDIHKD